MRASESFLGSAADNQKTAVHDMLLNQRTRAKTLRNDASQSTYHARISNLNTGAAFTKMSSNREHYKNKFFKPVQPSPIKVKDVD
jgi:hypothetical protein